jgi:fibronectin-binding autotransporter adhesin
MKPLRFSALVRGVTACTAAIITLTALPAYAVPYWWDGTGADNDWGNNSNWSASSAANPTPTTVPGVNDIANLTASGLTGPFNVNLNGNREVNGLATANLGTLFTLLGGSGASTLSIGAGGINHSSGGGLTIGSSTAGQEVNLSLTANQKWTSSAAGTGAAAMIINNSVSAAGGPVTLTLGGINLNAIINGAISDATGTINLVKVDSGIWTLSNTSNSVGSTQVDAGILRLTNPGALNPSAITVGSGGTLSLRVGGTGFTEANVDAYRSTVSFNSTGSLGLDTASGNFTYASNIDGAHGLTKLGGNTLTLSGTNTYSGSTTIAEGALSFSTIDAYNGGSINVASGAVLLATYGGSNLTLSQIETLRNAGVYVAGSAFAISTANGDLAYGTNLTGQMRFQKTGANTLFLTGSNSHTGGISVANGILSVDNILNGGEAGALGASTNAASNLNFTGGRLRYTGAGNTTDRLFQLSSSSTIDSSGTGALIFSNTGTNSTGSGGPNARTLTLTGYNKDANRISGIIANSGSAPNITSLTKYGSGNWTLSGANTFTGTIRPNGGVLTLDYGTSDPLSANASIVASHGTLEFKGKSSGITTDTILSYAIGEGHNSLGKLILNGNGGSGVQLTITTLGGSTTSQRHDLIDLSGNAGNSITVGALAPGSPATLAMKNGVLMNNNGGRANIVLRDTDGSYGFAALSGSTSGTLQKVATSNLTALAANTTVNMTASTANYLINAPGTYTQQSATNLVFNTVTMDSNAGAITLDLGANAIPAAADGKGMLFSGTNDININGSDITPTETFAGFGTSALWFHNYIADGKSLNIDASFGNNNFMIVGGTGTTLYSGQGLANTFILDGGLFRASKAQDTGATTMRINAGGVFEIGADLNETTAGDLTKTIGTSAGNIQFNGDSGLSAHGGNRVVNFGGAGAAVTWGASNFLTFGNSTDGDYTFKLSSALSDSTIEIQNGINLNGKTRVVEVANGSADTDATLSGVLSGDLSAGLIKTGAGTLSLTGTNTYQGATRVDAGRLIIGSGGINASTSIQVRNSTLQFAAQTSANSLVNDNALITLQDAILVTDNTVESFGPISIAGANQLQLGGSNILNIADSSTQIWSSTLAILNWGGLSMGGGDDQIYFGSDANGLTTSQLSKISFVDPTVDGQGYTGSFGANILASGEIVPIIPEPSFVSLVVLSAAGWLTRRRRVA